MERLRVIYSKSKEAIYISHLDVIRVFEEALSRADVSVCYSEGNNPRPDLVFAHPLSVGIESTGEIVEIGLNENVDIPFFIREINKVLPSGITVLAAEYVPTSEKNIMSRVYAATYIIEIVYNEDKLKDMTPRQVLDLKDDYQKKLQEYLSQQFILVVKKSKERMERIDIKPQIKSFNFSLDKSLEVKVDIGSKSNLKPEYILKGFNEYIDEILEYNIKRTKIYFE